jgi:hypothetical protein
VRGIVKRALVIALAMACGGARTTKDPAAPPQAAASPYETACRDYAERCPGQESATDCANIVDNKEVRDKCVAANKLDAYRKCIISDCTRTLHCGDGLEQCLVGCETTMGCTGP